MIRCFGFDTAVEESQRALLAAKVEASSARKGIGECQAKQDSTSESRAVCVGVQLLLTIIDVWEHLMQYCRFYCCCCC